MVIGYNPSHTNVNSEVNAPFKILSIMLRYLENELNQKKHKKQIPQDYGDNEEEEGNNEEGNNEEDNEEEGNEEEE